MTYLAGNINIRQEVHLDGDSSISRTVLAPAAFYVKGEAPLLIPADFRFASFSKEGADLVEYTCVSRRVGTRGTTDRWLVNVNNFIQKFDTANRSVATRY